jgi:hypothetical protein
VDRDADDGAHGRVGELVVKHAPAGVGGDVTRVDHRVEQQRVDARPAARAFLHLLEVPPVAVAGGDVVQLVLVVGEHDPAAGDREQRGRRLHHLLEGARQLGARLLVPQALDRAVDLGRVVSEICSLHNRALVLPFDATLLTSPP